MCILYNQRDATYIMFFIIIRALHGGERDNAMLQGTAQCQYLEVNVIEGASNYGKAWTIQITLEHTITYAV